MNIFLKLIKFIQFIIEYSQDFWVFVSHNGYSPFVEKNKRLFYKIIIETHTIEKGLSLENPRCLFGKDKIRFILSSLNRYDRKLSDFPVEMAFGALTAYVDYHRSIGITDEILNEIDIFLTRSDMSETKLKGGVDSYKIYNNEEINGKNFLLSRSSCRMLSRELVSLDIIKSLVQTAQVAPSQCNRQASKVHVYQSHDLIDNLLSIQGGARGFSQSIGNLLVISSDIAAWGGAGQRNQLYIDGALFAMNLILACHSFGLAVCPLNLAVTNSTERKIRLIGSIPEGERLIMMIAIGNTVNQPLRKAKSARRDTNEIITIHNT